jgi:hypothetical protein
MSNVIQFLETMGGNAAMARMSTSDYLAAVAMLEADEASRDALSSRDADKLGEALQARPFMMCLVVAPGDGNEPPSESPTEENPENPDEPPTQTS